MGRIRISTFGETTALEATGQVTVMMNAFVSWWQKWAG